MATIHHDLVSELPEYRDQIHQLKLSNAHFAKLFDEYHAVNREVLRVEAEGVPVADIMFENLKKQRLHLKDTLHGMLKSVA